MKYAPTPRPHHLVPLVGLLTLLGACTLFTAESRFYLQNTSAHSLVCTWVRLDGSTAASPEIPPGATSLLATGQLLEADRLPPSQYFASLSVAFSATPGIAVYRQAPTDDTRWAETTQGYKRADWTLRLGDADLSP